MVSWAAAGVRRARCVRRQRVGFPSESLAFNVARSAELVRVRAASPACRSPLGAAPRRAHSGRRGRLGRAERGDRGGEEEIRPIPSARSGSSRPSGPRRQRWPTSLACEVVDEQDVLPIRRDDIDYQFGSVDRSGWLFQQLLKLSADTISSSDHVLVLDADTVMIRPQSFHVRRQGRALPLR